MWCVLKKLEKCDLRFLYIWLSTIFLFVFCDLLLLVLCIIIFIAMATSEMSALRSGLRTLSSYVVITIFLFNLINFSTVCSTTDTSSIHPGMCYAESYYRNIKKINTPSKIGDKNHKLNFFNPRSWVYIQLWDRNISEIERWAWCSKQMAWNKWQ